MEAEAWSLSAEQREENRARAAENLFSLAYSRGKAVDDGQAREAAAALEDKAYTVARVESRTTTGARPAAESEKAYVRKLAALALEWAADEGAGTAAAQPVGEELDLTGEREFMTQKTAEQALAPLLQPGSRVKRVKLSTKSFSQNPDDDSAAVAARAFATAAASLTDVDMSDVIAGRPEAEALAALRTLAEALAGLRLRRLNLSDNALGEKGVRACARAFAEQEGLEFLAFENVGCSVNACAAVRDLLRHPGQLRTFHFFNNMSDDAGAASIAEVLKRAPLIEDFKMGSSRVGAAGGIALAEGLQAGQCLVRLDLSDNPMTGEVAGALARMVGGQPRLRALNLNDTSLGDAGVAALAQALTQAAPELQELELALNEVTAEGAKAVASMVRQKPQLQKLNLRENELGDKGAIWVATALSELEQLEIVDLTLNQVRRAGAVAVAKALGRSRGLKLLALDDNEISEAGVDQLKEALEAAGLAGTLGSLDENDLDAAEGASDEEGGVQDDDELAAAFAQTGLGS